MHMLETVCDPAIKDYTYGALNVCSFAKNKGCFGPQSMVCTLPFNASSDIQTNRWGSS